MALDKTSFNRTVHFLRRQFIWSKQYKNTMNRCRLTLLKSILKCEGCKRYICKTIEDKDNFIRYISSNFVYDNNKELILSDGSDISVEKFAVDHIEPVGTLGTSLDEAAAKIFCNESNLMGLCGSCHYFKTRIDVEEIKEKKLSLLDRLELGE